MVEFYFLKFYNQFVDDDDLRRQINNTEMDAWRKIAVVWPENLVPAGLVLPMPEMERISIIIVVVRIKMVTSLSLSQIDKKKLNNIIS